MPPIAQSAYTPRTSWWQPFVVTKRDAFVGARWYNFNAHFIEPDMVTRSWVINDVVYTGIILVFSLYVTVTVILSLIYTFDTWFWFAYFTNLSYVLLWAHYVVNSVHNVAIFSRYKPRFDECMPLLITQQLLYEMAITFHIVVPVGYWLAARLTTKNEPIYAYLNISRHGLEGFMVLFEFIVNKEIFIISHCFIIALIPIIYMLYGFAWRFLYFKKRWVYAAMAWEQGARTVARNYILGLLAFTVLIFIIYGMHMLKNYFLVRTGRYSRKPKNNV